MRPCIPPGSVAKARNMPDIAALSHLVRRTPEHLNLVNLFLREPLAGAGKRRREPQCRRSSAYDKWGLNFAHNLRKLGILHQLF